MYINIFVNIHSLSHAHLGLKTRARTGTLPPSRRGAMVEVNGAVGGRGVNRLDVVGAQKQFTRMPRDTVWTNDDRGQP